MFQSCISNTIFNRNSLEENINFQKLTKNLYDNLIKMKVYSGNRMFKCLTNTLFHQVTTQKRPI